MSFLTTSEYSLNGILLWVKEGGLTIGAASYVETSSFWLSREAALARRSGAGAVRSEMTMMDGSRVVLDYKTGLSPVPLNHDNLLDDLTARKLHQAIGISGELMPSAEFSGLYAVYLTHQAYWNNINILLAKLKDPEVSGTTADTLVTALTAAYSAPPAMALTTPLMSGQATFAEGGSCSFSALNGGIVTSYNLDLILIS